MPDAVVKSSLLGTKLCAKSIDIKTPFTLLGAVVDLSSIRLIQKAHQEVKLTLDQMSQRVKGYINYLIFFSGNLSICDCQ